ncbi:MAG: outer membrane protein OmpA-like peptidoglycan-associated protein, partial [Cyclobacteriaceae bacterium]
VNRYMFPEAVNAWKVFLKNKAYKSKEIVDETKDFIKDCERLVSFFDHTDDFEIHQLEAPINGKYAEMSPVYFEEKKELIYASASTTKSEDFKIYHSTRSGYEWTNPTELAALGIFSGENANVEVINEEGKLFLFNEKEGSLYYSEPSANGWGAPKEFDSKVSSKNLASHFFINTHEDRIIFVSKQKHHGLDLFESFKDLNSGKWSKPTALSEKINSIWDEESPYLSPDEQKLYFSSRRSGGVGGFDVYVSKFDNKSKSWGEPENLGWPINSPDDDIHFKMNTDQKSGYFVSNRIYSKGDYDIFFYWEIEKAFVEGRVLNALTNEVITSGEIRFHPSQYLVEYFRSPIDEQGRFKTELISDEQFKVEIISGLDTLGVALYEIHDSKGELITHIQDFYALSKNASEEEINIFKEKTTTIIKKDPKQEETVAIKVKSKIEEEPIQAAIKEPVFIAEAKSNIPEKLENLGNKYRTGNKSILQNIYFDFGTAQLTTESNQVLERLLLLMQNNPKLKIEIGGHTDNTGSPDINVWLSENRSQSVKKWLVGKGISKDRMITKGYGESQPLATNDDEVNGREINRRIEILVIE